MSKIQKIDEGAALWAALGFILKYPRCSIIVYEAKGMGDFSYTLSCFLAEAGVFETHVESWQFPDRINLRKARSLLSEKQKGFGTLILITDLRAGYCEDRLSKLQESLKGEFTQIWRVCN